MIHLEALIKSLGLDRIGDQNIVGLEPWMECLYASIESIHGKAPKFHILWAGRRAALGLVVFVKDGLLVDNLYSGSIGTGLCGIYGNKVLEITL